MIDRGRGNLTSIHRLRLNVFIVDATLQVKMTTWSLSRAAAVSRGLAACRRTSAVRRAEVKRRGVVSVSVDTLSVAEEARQQERAGENQPAGQERHQAEDFARLKRLVEFLGVLVHNVHPILQLAHNHRSLAAHIAVQEHSQTGEQQQDSCPERAFPEHPPSLVLEAFCSLMNENKLKNKALLIEIK